jgi:cation:H+ antiporter
VMEWLRLCVGGVCLYFGAEWFVGAAATLALALRVPQILVGLTVVAYGTSAPEVVVGVRAASSGHGELAIGNVIGSNIANMGLILGVVALVYPTVVNGALRRRERPVLVASTAFVPLLLMDGVVSRVEGAALLLVASGYLAWMVHAARGASERAAATVHAVAARDAAAHAAAQDPPAHAAAQDPSAHAAAQDSPAHAAADALVVAVSPHATRVHVRGLVHAGATALTGLGVLLVGGSLFVDGAAAVAHSLGMSERLVGLTVVAFGTSLPELVSSLIAARRGHADLAVGNVVGSNICNVLLCLGAASVASPLRAPLGSLWVELTTLVLMTFAVAIFIRSQRTLTRIEGAAVLMMYAVFTVATVARR